MRFPLKSRYCLVLSMIKTTFMSTHKDQFEFFMPVGLQCLLPSLFSKQILSRLIHDQDNIHANSSQDQFELFMPTHHRIILNYTCQLITLSLIHI